MADGSVAALGEVLRGQRVRRGLTQHDLALRAGLSIRAVRDIERGRVRRPRRDSVRRLTEAVGLDPAEVARSAAVAESSPWRPGVTSLDIGVLGPLTVHHVGQPVDVGPAKQRCLLGLLALQPNRPVSCAEIVDVLWGEHPPPTFRNLIHGYVARLRKLLGSPRAGAATARVISGVAGGYRLTVQADQLDLLRFEELADRAREAQPDDPEAALALFAGALECWRGPVLADLPGELRQHPAAVAVSRLRLGAVLAYADLAIGLGRYQEAADQLHGLVAEEPLHEGAYARLVVAVAGTGQRASALALFTEVRDRLVDELGVEPGPELRDAQARVLRGEVPPARPHFHGTGGAAARPPVPAQLPAGVVGFTGRTEQLQRLDDLLPAPGTSTTVVTTVIVGMAGVGKTALAVHWAHRAAGRFGDGQLYVDLRGYGPGPPLPPVQALAGLLRSLGVPGDRIPVELDEAASLYRTLLAGRRMLVVLDNARGAEQVRPLLPGGPGSMVVITSRNQLTGLVATHGAVTLALDVLAPGDAVALLARVLGGDRSAAEPEAVAELARACGRLPLALRIAAAKVAGESTPSIAGHVAGLRDGDQLNELAVDGDAHAAVRVAFDRSYEHLGPDARRLFRLLGLAPGADITAPAAAALAVAPPGPALRLLARLAGAHLLEPRGPHRFGLHDLVRLYARARTEAEDTPAEQAEAVGRLFEWYLHTAGAAAMLLYPGMPRLPVPPATDDLPPAGFADAAGAVGWLDAERANLIAAVQHTAVHGPHRIAWLLADTLRGYFWLRRDTVDWMVVAGASAAAAADAGDPRAQAASQLSLGGAYQSAGRYPEAIQHYTAAHTASRQDGWIDGEATALGTLGMAYWWAGDLQRAADHHREALELHRRTGRWSGEANALLNLGLVYRDLGRLREAADLQTRSLDLHRRLGVRDGEAHALCALGELEHDLGRGDRADQHLTRALELHRELGDRFGEARTLRVLGTVLDDSRGCQAAASYWREALRLFTEIGSPEAEGVRALLRSRGWDGTAAAT